MSNAHLQTALILAREAAAAGDPVGAGEICAAVARLAAKSGGGDGLREALEAYQRAADPRAGAAALLEKLEKRVPDAPTKSADDASDPLAIAKRRITLAITIGAPVYNARDHAGCFAIYAAVARTLLANMKLPGHVRARLEASLFESKQTADADQRAWAMRHGFDAIQGMSYASPAGVKTLAAADDPVRSLDPTASPGRSSSADVVHYPDGDLYPNTTPPIWKPKDGPPIALTAGAPPSRKSPKTPAKRRG